MGHAILSPSGASRWLACTPSARLEMQFPDSESQAAKEGTLAHELGEALIAFKSGKITKAAYQKKLKLIQADSLYQPEMLGYCEEYATFVVEKYAEAQVRSKIAALFLEYELDLTKYVPEGFGTADNVIIADGTMEIIDLKYGKGVAVSAESNKQMTLYALGALDAFEVGFDIDEVLMTIYQPRIDNTSTWCVTVEELKQWAENELAPKARKAFDGAGEFQPGSHCLFCRAKATCKAKADYELEVVKYEFQDGALLNDEEIVDILNRADRLINWAKGVQKHALHEAVTNGKTWPGYKIVEGRSVRKYPDENTVVNLLTEKGFSEDSLFKKKLINFTELKGVISAATFKNIIDPILLKPNGKPALVPESDKRPEMNREEAAKAGFDDEVFDAE